MDWKAINKRYPRAVWLGSAAVLALVAVSFWVQYTLGKPAVVPVWTPVEVGDVEIDVEATGTVDAVTTVDVGAQVSSTINKLFVDFNSPVKKDQVLATMEDSRFVAAVKQAEADLQAARAAVRMAESGVETARADEQVARAGLARAEAVARQAQLDFERAQGLLQSEISSVADRDRLKAAHEGAQAGVVSAGAQVEQASARLRNSQAQLLQARAQEKNAASALEVARTNLSYTVIRSPIDGIVVARNVDTGQTVAARLSAPSLFNIAQDLEEMYVYTKLDVRDVPLVKPGQKATFTVDAYPRMNWEGTVAQVRIAPITQLKGQAAPSQLGAPAASTVAGLQQQTGGGSGAGASAPAGSSGSPAGSGAASSSSGTASSAGGTASQAAGSTPAPGLVQYDALVRFTNRDRRLLPGMTAYVTIPVSAAYHVVRVRKEALHASPSVSLEDKNALLRRHGIQPGQNIVWIAEGAAFRPIPVTVGMTDYLFAEINGNLQPGQRVLAGYRQRNE